jgi:carbohydrate-selective porin OprB
MLFLPESLLRKLSSPLLAVLLYVFCANSAAAATTQSAIGAGSLDDWLALGLALLAALYCVQKRE